MGTSTKTTFAARGALSALLLIALCLAPALAKDNSKKKKKKPESTEVAMQFVDALMDKRFDELPPLLDSTMKRALSPAVAEQLLPQSERQFGKVLGVGQAWKADHLMGVDRCRIPVAFEKGLADLMVAVDRWGQVAGVFIQDHIEPPDPSFLPQVKTADGEAVKSPGSEMPEGLREIEVEVGPESSTLPGTITLPPKAMRVESGFAGVVLVHGSGGHDRDETVGPNKPFRELAWGLAQQGIAVVRYEKRTYKKGMELVNEHGMNFTVQHEVIDDALAAVSLLAKNEEVDAARVFVVGHSLGGAVAPRIAAQSERVAGLVSLAGLARPLHEVIPIQMKYISKLDGDISEQEQKQLDAIEAQLAPLRAALAGEGDPPAGAIMGAGFAYYEDMQKHAPADVAKTLKVPMLFVQGGRDYQVTLEDLALFEDAVGDRENVCVVVYPTLNHLFHAGEGPSKPAEYARRGQVDPRVIEAVGTWILGGGCPGAGAKPANAGS